MARIRTIKPEFFDDPKIGKLSPLARLAFIGLLCQADSAGRVEDEPERLKVRVLPYDTADMDAILSELAHVGVILRYEANTTRVIQVTNFQKHQRPHPKEAPSLLPELAVKKHGKPRKETASREKDRTSRVDSGVLDSGVLDSGSLDTGSPSSADADGFDAFWTAYPRKTAIGEAKKAWKKLKPSAWLQAHILEAIANQRQCRQWLSDGGKFIPHPATWLNQSRWDDEPEPDVAQTSTKTAGNVAALAAFNRSLAR